jgi:hypothetical protein
MIREPLSPSTSARGLATALLPLSLVLAGSAALAQGTGYVFPPAQTVPLAFPQSGVVCDPAGQICYDRQGISMGLTRTYYGRRAEQQLLRQFSNQPMPQEFRLSDGSVCSLPARTCWSDGWKRRVPNQRLATQLFGPGNQVLSKENGYCRLDNWGLRIYNGRCRLVRAVGSPDFRGSTYTVRLPNRNDVVFGNRNGYLVARNGGRDWPVQFQNLGNNTALFRWGTQQLIVNTLTYGPGGSFGAPPLPSPTYNTPYRSTYSGSGVNWNGGLEGFLNGLFQ